MIHGFIHDSCFIHYVNPSSPASAWFPDRLPTANVSQHACVNGMKYYRLQVQEVQYIQYSTVLYLYKYRSPRQQSATFYMQHITKFYCFDYTCITCIKTGWTLFYFHILLYISMKYNLLCGLLVK